MIKGPNEIAREWNEQQSQSISPWDDYKSHSVSSKEPLATLRLALDQRLIENKTPEMHLYATSEMLGYAKQCMLAVAHLDLRSVVHELAAFETERGSVLDKMIAIGRQEIDEDSMFNLTSGPVPMKSRLLSIAMDSGASAVSIAHGQDQVVHEHGKQGVNEIEPLLTRWDKLGVAGLMRAFGREVKFDRGGIIRDGGRVWSDVSRPEIFCKEEKGLMQPVAELLLQDLNNIPIVGIGVTTLTSHGKMKEIDAVAVKKGKLLHVEVKNCSSSNVAKNLYDASRQLSDPNGIVSGHKERIVVLPRSPEEMIEEMSDKQRRKSAWDALFATRAACNQVFGLEEFEDYIVG